MRKKIIIKYKKRRVNVIAEDCNFLQRLAGLMFSHREKAKILLFRFRNKQKIRIHSFFVFYPFVAVWLDGKSRVVDLKIVKPFIPCISHKGMANKLIEIPINSYYKNLTKGLFPTTKRNI